MLHNLSALAPCSLLADCAHIIGMIVVLKDDVEHINLTHEALVLSKGAAALPFLFGVAIYCYEGISMILPLEDSMAEKSKVMCFSSFIGDFPVPSPLLPACV
jgi:solute carrier family 36 (proton-coupled amino acid transporter)